MSHPRNKLDRKRQNEMPAKYSDTLGLHEYQGSTWIVLKDGEGDDILRIYQVTEQQLADLHAQIGQRLGLASAATMEHLRRLHGVLDEIIQRDDAERREREERALQEWTGSPGTDGEQKG